MRPRILRAFPRAMAAKNSPSCCRTSPKQGAMKVAEAIRLTVRRFGLPNTAASRGYVTISAGVATRTRSTLGEAALVGEADAALYEAKRFGRNRSVAYLVAGTAICRHRIDPTRSAVFVQKSNGAFSNFLPIREAIHTHNLPVALSRDSPWMGAEAWRSQMTAIARALSRAFTTAADVEVLKQLLLFCLAGPVRVGADDDIRSGSEPGPFLAQPASLFSQHYRVAGCHERSSDSTRS